MGALRTTTVSRSEWVRMYVRKTIRRDGIERDSNRYRHLIDYATYILGDRESAIFLVDQEMPSGEDFI